LLVGAALLVAGGALERAEGALTTKANSILFFAGVTLMGTAAYVIFRAPPEIGWGTRALLVVVFTGGLAGFLMADGVPGLGGRGIYFSTPALVSILLALLGKRNRER
jgi:hypothetical protein